MRTFRRVLRTSRILPTITNANATGDDQTGDSEAILVAPRPESQRWESLIIEYHLSNQFQLQKLIQKNDRGTSLLYVYSKLHAMARWAMARQ